MNKNTHWFCRGCFNCSSIEIKSNDGPTIGFVGVWFDIWSTVVGLAARNTSWTVLGFNNSSFIVIVGDDDGFGEVKLDDVCNWLRLALGRLKTSDGRSSISPRMVVDTWRSRSSISRPNWGLGDWEWCGVVVNFVATAALTAASAAAWAKMSWKRKVKIFETNKYLIACINLPNNFISINGLGGGGNGKLFADGKRMGTRPVPSVFIGNRFGCGGRSEDCGRVKLGGGKRPNGGCKFRLAFPIDVGGKGNGQAAFVVVVVVVIDAVLVLPVVTAVVDVLSIVDVGFWIEDDGLVLFVEETALFVVSSLSGFSVESVSENRLGLILKKKESLF